MLYELLVEVHFTVFVFGSAKCFIVAKLVLILNAAPEMGYTAGKGRKC
jgi:hypothetical protein